MPYDPRMLQMAQQGVRMMAPEPSPFERNEQPPQRPKQWWEQSMPAQKPNDPNAPSGSAGGDPRLDAPKPPPSLLDLMMGLGRMTRPEYDRAIQYGTAQGSPRPAVQYGTAQGSATASPWAWLGQVGGAPR